MSKAERVSKIKDLVRRMSAAKDVSGGILTRAREEQREISEKEQGRMKQSFSDFDTAWGEFRETFYSDDAAERCENRDQRLTVAKHVAWNHERGVHDDNGPEFVPGSTRNGGLSFEQRSFGAGGACESRRFEEVLHRSGMSPDQWGEDGNGWRDADEFLAVVASQRGDPRLQRRTGNKTFPDSQGGFAVPTPLAAEIFNQALEREIVRPLARPYTLTSGSLDVPCWDGEDHTSSTFFGGIKLVWEGEGEELSIKEAKLRSVKLAAKKGAFIGKVSTELAEDSPTFARDFRRALVEAAAYGMDNAFFNGDNVKQPQGVLSTSNPALVTVTKETSQVANTIMYENIVKMWARMHPAGHGNCVWVANANTVPALYTMNLAIGTAGVPVYLPANGAAGSPHASLFGRPLLFSEKVPTLGTKGDLGLYDFSQYAVGMRGDITLAISPHVYFSSDELAFRLRLRVDGKSLWDAPITPANGADTLSPFVVLETRA